MSENEKPITLYLMRDPFGRVQYGWAESVNEFTLERDQKWHQNQRICGGIPVGLLGVLRPDLKLEPGGGPIEVPSKVKPTSEAFDRRMVEQLVETLREQAREFPDTEEGNYAQGLLETQIQSLLNSIADVPPMPEVPSKEVIAAAGAALEGICCAGELLDVTGKPEHNDDLYAGCKALVAILSFAAAHQAKGDGEAEPNVIHAPRCEVYDPIGDGICSCGGSRRKDEETTMPSEPPSEEVLQHIDGFVSAAGCGCGEDRRILLTEVRRLRKKYEGPPTTAGELRARYKPAPPHVVAGMRAAVDAFSDSDTEWPPTREQQLESTAAGLAELLRTEPVVNASAKAMKAHSDWRRRRDAALAAYRKLVGESDT